MTQLTNNFSLSEVTDWPKFQNISASDKTKLQNWINEVMANTTNRISVIHEAKRIATHLQELRNVVNTQFPQFDGKIGIRPLCWLRPKAWEIFRGRSGEGQHPTGNAVDFIVVNVPNNKVQVVMDWIWDYLNGKNGGNDWNGGLARLHLENRTRLIHVDLGRKRRWKY